MWDDVFNVIYSWGHRYLVELGFTLLFFLILHFGIYPLVIRRHDAQTLQQIPSIKTGDITTFGNDSPVVVGADAKKVGVVKDAQPRK